MSSINGLAKKFYSREDVLAIAAGECPGLESIHKFGKNSSVGQTFVPICVGSVYRTPQISAATTLRIKAGNAGDTAAGVGAREVTLQMLDETGAFVQESLSTAGASASSPTTTTAIRLLRAWVSSSGTYASTTTNSHVADIVIENSASTEDWATIDFSSLGRGQTEIGCYTVPLGKTAFINGIIISVDSTKNSDILMCTRESILDTTPPYKSFRTLFELGSISGQGTLGPKVPAGPFTQLTDIIFMGRLAVSSSVIDIDFEIILKDN